LQLRTALQAEGIAEMPRATSARGRARTAKALMPPTVASKPQRRTAEDADADMGLAPADVGDELLDDRRPDHT